MYLQTENEASRSTILTVMTEKGQTDRQTDRRDLMYYQPHLQV